MEQLSVSLKNAPRIWKLDNVISMTKVTGGYLVIKFKTGESRYRCSRSGDTLIVSGNRVTDVIHEENETVPNQDNK